MNRALRIALLLGMWLPLATAAMAAEGSGANAVALSEKLFLITDLGESGNVAFLVTDQGVLVVDSGSDPDSGQKIMSLIRERTNQPVRFVVLTHYHGDHTYGMPAFPDAAIVAHENLPANQQRDREELQSALARLPARIAAQQENIRKLGKKKSVQRGQEEEKLRQLEARYAGYQAIRIVPPTILFNSRMVIQMAGERVEIIHPSPAHTNDNAIVYFPGQKVVHLGDMLFHRCHPYIDWQAGSNTANWISRLREVEQWPVEKVIPGHGPTAGKEALAEQLQYLADLRTVVTLELKKGTALEALKKIAVPRQWNTLGWPDLWPLSLEAVYREMGGKSELLP